MNNNVKFNNLKSDFKSCTQVRTAPKKKADIQWR